VTPLGDRIAALIAQNGPITVADYMALCLGDPEHGYYMAREPFGRSGDFVTAPEVSQVFGELIGVWAVATFEAMGSPSSFVLAELGPGRGTLIADLYRAARLRPSFLDAARVHLVETSPRLRAVQEATLSGVPVAWHADVASLPSGPAIVIANEFFDALPIRQYVRSRTGWAERMVGLDDSGRLKFGLRPLPAGSVGEVRDTAADPTSPLPLWERDRVRGSDVSSESDDSFKSGDLTPSPAPPAFAGVRDLSHEGRGGPASPAASPPSPSPRRKPGSIAGVSAGPDHPPSRQGLRWTPAFAGVTEEEPDILETSPAATAIISALASRIAAEGGAALIIDYGYEGPAFGDTLQAVRGHAYADPLAEPGAADLTAHIDFGALARAATEAGASPRSLVTQGEFLGRLGIAARATRLAAGKDAQTREAVAAAVHRLVAPDAMGDLFKVLALSQSGLALPAFDGDA
jgi:SAM-dependent MidA family methyltransferase